MSDDMKRFLEEELKKEADQILQEVEADSEVADLKAPEEIDEMLYEQIRQYKEKQDVPEAALSEQQQEWIRLGKIYQRKRKKRKYVVLAAAMMATFAIGITSFGEPERIFEKFNWSIGNREQTNFDSDSEDIVAAKFSEEEEAYQKIKDEFGFDPVRILYLPENMKFQESIILREIQSAYLVYGDVQGKSISYQMSMDYSVGSVGTDIEDKVIKEHTMEIENVDIQIVQYQVLNSVKKKSRGVFEYKGIQYFITGNNLEEVEFEKILKNLKFF